MEATRSKTPRVVLHPTMSSRLLSVVELEHFSARAAAALEEGDADERLTTSCGSSTDSDAGSGSTADSVSEP